MFGNNSTCLVFTAPVTVKQGGTVVVVYSNNCVINVSSMYALTGPILIRTCLHAVEKQRMNKYCCESIDLLWCGRKTRIPTVKRRVYFPSAVDDYQRFGFDVQHGGRTCTESRPPSPVGLLTYKYNRKIEATEVEHLIVELKVPDENNQIERSRIRDSRHDQIAQTQTGNFDALRTFVRVLHYRDIYTANVNDKRAFSRANGRGRLIRRLN